MRRLSRRRFLGEAAALAAGAAALPALVDVEPPVSGGLRDARGPATQTGGAHAGDLSLNGNGQWWVCTASGAPGTWRPVS